MARKKQIVQVEEKEEEEKEEVEEEVEEEEEEEEEGKEEEEGERRRSSWVWGLFFFFLLFCGEGSTFTRSNLTKEQLINSFRLQFETLALPWFLLHSFKSFNFPPLSFFLSLSFFHQTLSPTVLNCCFRAASPLPLSLLSHTVTVLLVLLVLPSL